MRARLLPIANCKSEIANARSALVRPLPIYDFGHVDAVLIRISPASELFVPEPILCVRSDHLQFRHTIDHVNRDAVTVGFVSYRQFERGVDVPLFLVPAHMEIV